MACKTLGKQAAFGAPRREIPRALAACKTLLVITLMTHELRRHTRNKKVPTTMFDHIDLLANFHARAGSGHALDPTQDSLGQPHHPRHAAASRPVAACRRADKGSNT